MTTNPRCLLDVRELLHDHLGIPNIALGISGDAPHAEGGDSYHLGADQIRPRNGVDRYSVDESSRDRNGLSDFASALDIGEFSVRVAGKSHDLRSFSIWLVAQCKANTVDTRDIREVIYSPDGSVVKRWDRLSRRSSGDGSHRFHTHVSFHRDAIKAGRDQAAVFRRYLTEIGLLEGDDMNDLQDKRLQAADARLAALVSGKTSHKTVWSDANPDGAEAIVPNQRIQELGQRLAAQDQKLAALAAAVAGVDEATAVTLRAEFDEIDTAVAATLTAIAEVPEETLDALGAVESPAEIADLLRPVLGDKATAVGAILAAG